MNLHLLLHTLSSQGIKLAANHNSLAVDAPKGVLTPELRDALLEHKIELLELLRQNSLNNAALPPIIPEPNQRYAPFPLTDMQHAFWVGRSGVFELGNVANHGYYEIEGQNLNLERLNQGLHKLIDRHDMLRAIVLADGQQQILETVPPYEIKVLDLRGKDQGLIASELAAIRDRLSHQVLPADRFPLFEFCVTLLDKERFRLHISYDLQVFDAWSLFRLFDEWHQLYQDPERELTPLTISFRDYVLAEQAIAKTELYARSQNYWFARLDSLPNAPELPLAKHPQEIKNHLCQRYQGGLAPEEWRQLKQKAGQAGLTPTGVLMAAFAEIITVWSKNPQFTINLALFNRLPLHTQVNDILGDFTSVNLLAVDNSTPEAFSDRALRLQKQLWQDLEHRYISGVKITRELARKKGTAPSAMPVVFTSTLGFSSIGQDTLTFSRFGELVYGISQASQAWMDVQVWEEKETLTFNWDVVKELFYEGLIEDMFEAYCRFLKQLATNDSAWHATERQLIPPAQLARREALNNTTTHLLDTTLQGLFSKQVAQRPEKTAVVASDRTLTYQELSDRSHRVAHRLRSLGVTSNQLVAIVMEKGWEQIVAVMGIITSGAAYIPIDPQLPQQRKEYLLEHSQAKIILTQSWLLETLKLPAGIETICLDTDDLADESNQALEPIQTDEDLAYVIYTSGSTGLPKGVAIAHRNVINVVVQTNQRFHIDDKDSILNISALHHDLSVYDIFGLLSAGGTIVIPDAEKIKDPSHWAELITREAITLWNSVPPMMEMLVDRLEMQPQSLPQSLRLAILGGDWLPVSLPDRLRALIPQVKILSIGGPTETTVWNIGYEIAAVEPTWKSIPYGKPMANSKYYILNEMLDDCPVWVTGEMYCAGVQLAKGYWQDQAKTNAKFIIHPRTGERIYRTGDMGRYLPDGNIEFLGRVDLQLKIRGYRIEAGEIEATLTQHPEIKAAVVVAIKKQNREYLVAYLVAHSSVPPAIVQLRCFLGDRLPEYMIPSAFIFLDALPLSANGKIDRRQLAEREYLEEIMTATYIAPQNNLEIQIAAVWQEVLGLEKVGINDNFFDVGGDSLSIAKVFNKLNDTLPNQAKNISFIEMYKYTTISSLANYLGSNNSTSLDMTNIEEKTSNELKKRHLGRLLNKSKLK
ncbi:MULTISPECIES: non-ribosomal peptide synthetase [unclassified Nodularia (in: cyanobacteria)]|uniref:non-ribosomal peptide synthetase n=1 Tax=unclassified Nodularia (in: cyanobacteria) TaxID=2656917 RepID=UPI00188054BE|nr:MULTISPECIES: non-ribosomal peptide synthetase [unclassified Nodularia (in: cyanobacteria)]MBE9201697.1 amino acid adenylation domain-containing protein [Nodularia sp. LEGE 06071]MCC2691275.1 amino acid adenylation domain-containing protein [Nodularia sp. LEGE 04288]